MVFPREIDSEVNPGLSLSASLNPDRLKNHWEKFQLAKLEYFVAIDDASGDLAGVVGLYEKTIDPGNVWLAWFFVDPNQRGKGFGEKLLRLTIDKARSYNYKALRLYTSTAPEELAAQNLYEKVGLKIIDESKFPVDVVDQVKRLIAEYKVIFREIEL